MKKLFILCMISVALITGFFGRTMISAMAEEPDQVPLKRYYSSIVIEDGQSLWSIAQTYNVDSVMSTQDYVRELKSMNSLKTDTIHTGRYLTILYFEEDME